MDMVTKHMNSQITTCNEKFSTLLSPEPPRGLHTRLNLFLSLEPPFPAPEKMVTFRINMVTQTRINFEIVVTFATVESDSQVLSYNVDFEINL